MSDYYGDYKPSQVVVISFNTVNSAGSPASMTAGSPSLVIRKNGTAVTPSGGLTLTIDSGGFVGLNDVSIDMSVDIATFSSGSDYQVRLGAGTVVGSNSIANTLLGKWSLENRTTTVGTITGTVGTVTTNGNFLVIFDTAYLGNVGNLIAGDKKLTFTTGLNHVATGTVTGGTLTDTLHASLTFSTLFGQTVTLGDKFIIYPS